MSRLNPPRSSGSWTVLDERVIGQSLGNFQVTGVLGAGGMSTVYAAKDKLLDRRVALKVFPRAFADSERDYLAAFLRDARTASRVVHPNVITIYNVGYARDLFYVAMELMDAGSLRTVLEREGAMALDRALHYLIQAARGLFAAHECGIVHRDVKPANLMLTKDDQLKVADFGLAHTLDLNADLKGELTMGTPLYMAPELCVGNPPSPRSDIYALGVTFYTLLTNSRPYFAPTVREVFRMHVESPIPELAEKRTDLPAGVQTLLNRCMAKNPLDRYRTCADLADDFQFLLETILAGTPADLLGRRYRQGSSASHLTLGVLPHLRPLARHTAPPPRPMPQPPAPPAPAADLEPHGPALPEVSSPVDTASTILPAFRPAPAADARRRLLIGLCVLGIVATVVAVAAVVIAYRT